MKRSALLRILSVLCLAAVLLGAMPAALAYGAASNWARAELDGMEALGLIPAELEEKESLKSTITRLEMCAVAVRAYETYTKQEIPLPETDPFSDTGSPVVAKAHAVGLVKGYENGTFHPDEVLAREQFFAFVYQFLQAVGWTPQESDFADLSAFADTGAVSGWALPATRLVVGIGVVKGDERGLSPHGTTTCEQALAMFYRAYIFLTGPADPPAPTEPADPTTPELPFAEKYPNLGNWAKEELAPMDEMGLIPGILLGRDMASPITRREMCYVAVEAYRSLHPDLTGTEEASPFTDVNDGTITEAYYLGLVNGFPDGTFLPDTPITREQFFKITVNFLTAAGFNQKDAPATVLSRFSDADRLSNYAKPCARLLVSLGILQGDGSRLLPKSSTQCQQALALFFRSYNFLIQWQENPAEPGDRPEAQALVDFAMQFEGCDYIWGGKDPSTGFDCSGFVWYVYTQNGYTDLGRTATDQWYYEKSWEVPESGLLPGDLLFFSDSYTLNDITHVGIYIGDGQFIHAANSRDGVVVTPTSSSYYVEKFVGARRIIE